ncbi:hypothetical protein LCGC14_0397290 [marine sediment metagenome]|uniref:Uncharacterized protein n=1 Tax=marine sediment metagenome TaxID=412755 RepID=A0A0F9VJV1_9ZZZZ
MAITASGLMFISLEKMLTNAAALNLEAEDYKGALVDDNHTPNFDTDATWNNTNEVSGTGWAAGGVALTGTEITTSSGTWKLDATDVSETTTTLTSVMAYRWYADPVADEEILVVDFVTAVNTVAGTFAITWHADGIATHDFTP